MSATVPGAATLEVQVEGQRSTVTSAFARSPLKLLVPRPRGLSVNVCTTNFGGGMVAGDSTRLDLLLHADTRCLLGTQASTKIYRGPRDRPCRHQTIARLGDRSLLAYVPDPIQAFAGSSFHQDQVFHLGHQAGLVLVDAVSSGRPACGERWAFQEFTSRSQVWLGPDRIFVDSLRLDARSIPITSPFRGGRFDCLAMVAILGYPFREEAQAVARDITSVPPSSRAGLVGSASPHPHGAILRVAGESMATVAHYLLEHLRFLQPLLADTPWSRRW